MAEERRINQVVNLSQGELYRRVMVDELTGVYNRRTFLTCLDEIIKTAALQISQVSILILDILKFKSINDTYGHLTEDKAIMEVSRFLKERYTG